MAVIRKGSGVNTGAASGAGVAVPAQVYGRLEYVSGDAPIKAPSAGRWQRANLGSEAAAIILMFRTGTIPQGAKGPEQH